MLPGGQHLHLIGSIHMGTRDMSPLPPALVEKLSTADALIVEADISGNESPLPTLIFRRLSTNDSAKRS